MEILFVANCADLYASSSSTVVNNFYHVAGFSSAIDEH